VGDLARDGYITVERVERRNRDRVATYLPLRHPAEQNATVGDLVRLLGR
jgi:hypothetical protein